MGCMVPLMARRRTSTAMVVIPRSKTKSMLFTKLMGSWTQPGCMTCHAWRADVLMRIRSPEYCKSMTSTATVLVKSMLFLLPSLYTYYIPRSRTTMARGHVRPYAAVMNNRMVSSLRHHTSGMSRGRPTGDRSSDLHTECWRSTGRATAMAYWLQAEP